MTSKEIAASLAIIATLSTAGIQLEQADQLNNIHQKNGVNEGITLALMSISDSYLQEVEDALVSEYEADGYVELDNFYLQNGVLDKHFKKLKAEDALPDWYFDPGEFTNEQIFLKINESLKNN